MTIDSTAIAEVDSDSKKIVFAAAIYASAMVLANASIAAFGPWVSPINSFLFIGLDLALRDWLHLRLRPVAMGALIVASGSLTWALNAAPAQIAIASSIAFICAASADWAAFSALRGKRWLVRSNGSNVVGAAVDSALFPTIAFGVLMPGVVAMQFAAKVAGGALWAWILRK